MIRKYPIGLQSFREIRKGGYVYVDKTETIYRLVETGKHYFLSRPRRFGKSLLVDTMHELFAGSEELFKGLWIHDKWDWSKTNPVIHLSMSKIPYQKLGLYDALFKELDALATPLGVVLEETDLKSKFWELIRKTSAQGQVIILIDEYDKPLIDYLDHPEKMDENRSVFKQFYSVLKDADRFIRLLFLTGVSRFSQVSIFSDLNNLNDITTHRHYATLLGITQAELERDFAKELAELTAMDAKAPDTLREWYNGYLWHPAGQRVYNPFSLLKFMESYDYRNYWFATGTPTFLVKQLQKRKAYNVEGIRLGELSLATFEVDNPNPGPLLFQTGYLTIKSVSDDGQVYELSYPNREVRASLLDGLLSTYREIYPADSMALVADLKTALKTGDSDGIITCLDALIGTIPYDHWRADTESIFNIITFLAFKLAGVDVHTEVHSAQGRCDVLVKSDDYIYVIELKLDGTAQEALKQILDTGYLQPYRNDPRGKIALGVAFSSAERRVAEHLVKIVDMP